jgi:hypothetical protein
MRKREPHAPAREQAGSKSIPFAAGYDSVVTIPPGLLNYYEFLELLDERKILDTGSVNHVSIIASTPAFPQILIKGYFDPEGTSLTENAEDPNNFEWSAKFIVSSTYPAFNSATKLRALFQQMTGKSTVGRVIVDPSGLRRDSFGNIMTGAEATAAIRRSLSIPNPQSDLLHRPPPGVDPRGSSPADVSWRSSRTGTLPADSEARRDLEGAARDARSAAERGVTLGPTDTSRSR